MFSHLHWFAIELARRPGILPAHFWSALFGEAGSLGVAGAIVVVWRVRAARRARARREHGRHLLSRPYLIDEGIDDLQRVSTELDPQEVSRN